MFLTFCIFLPWMLWAFACGPNPPRPDRLKREAATAERRQRRRDTAIAIGRCFGG